MTAYAFIPARGGSKGVPRKNLQIVGAKALVARTVAAARAARTIDRVFVTTDDDEIATVARDAGAEIIDRPGELSGDGASSESALLHALDVLEATGEPLPDVSVMLQCTSPFSTSEDIDGTVAALEGEDADSAFSAIRTYGFLWRRGPAGALAVNHDAATRPRRQDREADYLESGAVYAMRTYGFRTARHRFFGRIAIHEVDATHGLEIDERHDLAVARALAAALEPAGNNGLPERVDALVLDFDGVVTDNRVMTLQDGTEVVISDRGDGLGIERLRDAGVRVLVLSKERNPVVAARAKKLGVEVLQAIDDKVPALRSWLREAAIESEHTVFVGNDVNDRGCLELVACGAVVADAHPDVMPYADLVLAHPGGRGAIREIADRILAARLESE